MRYKINEPQGLHNDVFTSILFPYIMWLCYGNNVSDAEEQQAGVPSLLCDIAYVTVMDNKLEYGGLLME